MRKRTSSDNARRSLSKGGIVRGPKTNGKKVSAAALPTDLSTCDTMITPDCLRALYNINRTPTETAKNTFAIGTQFQISLQANIFVDDSLQSNSLLRAMFNLI